ncbi:MAG TPA: ArsR family transcriptional regulator [Candidatus Eisenbergiella stercoravium]|nr:ArsR family transcriptional regulator [Candidatus Eisenbergiella stercoravium]
MADIGNKTAEFNLDDIHALRMAARALSSETRLAILKLLQSGSKSIGELSEELQIPMSTISTSVSILADAKLIITENKPQERGMLKLCSPFLSQIIFHLSSDTSVETSEASKTLTMNMPVGCYTDAESITPTCGLCSEYSVIGEKDAPLSFFHPDRFSAQRVWFHSGFLEYRFSFVYMNNIIFKWMEISFETCSEAPMYRDPWKSDISVYVNGKELGVFESPCDCGGVRGALTPAWNSILSTQYGFLKTWRLDESGTYLDGIRINDLCISDISFSDLPYISVKIGVSENAVHVGGINLFGDKFGNYAQPLVLKLGYQLDK